MAHMKLLRIVQSMAHMKLLRLATLNQLRFGGSETDSELSCNTFPAKAVVSSTPRNDFAAALLLNFLRLLSYF